MHRKVAGFFAGIGGFELGLSRAGFETSLLCEIEPSAQAVLRARFPGVELASDIREVDRLGTEVGMLVGGFPCQDVSTSGEKIGIEGERTGLVSEVFRILRNSNVDWVILENVPFLLKLGKGNGIRSVVDVLEDLGYSWAYRVLDTFAFGLPQKRRRVFIVASRVGDPRGVLLADMGVKVEYPPVSVDRPVGFYWTEGRYGASLIQDGVPTLKGGSGWGIPSPPAIVMPNGFVGTPDIRDAERLQGFPENWTAPAEKVAKGARWKAVGNAVSVPVAEWIGQRITSPGSYSGDGDRPLESGKPWPNAAWNVGMGRHEARVTEWPMPPSHETIDLFLKHPMKRLSRRATDGVADRVEASGIKYPSNFLDALRCHSEMRLFLPSASPKIVEKPRKRRLPAKVALPDLYDSPA